MKRSRTIAITLLLLATAGPPCAAQYEEDEETEDQRRRDEEYYKRYLQEEEQPPPAAPADDAELAEAFLAKADELIRDKNHRSVIGARYKIQTDDPRLDLKSVDKLLESFRGFFDAFWTDRAPGRTYDRQGRFFLIYSYHKYNQLVGGDWSRQVVRPKGHYGSMFDAVVIHTDSDRAGGLPNTLVHESAHQLVDQILYGGTVSPSLWVSEGLATYYENTFMNADGKFETGVVVVPELGPPDTREIRDQSEHFLALATRHGHPDIVGRHAGRKIAEQDAFARQALVEVDGTCVDLQQLCLGTRSTRRGSAGLVANVTNGRGGEVERDLLPILVSAGQQQGRQPQEDQPLQNVAQDVVSILLGRHDTTSPFRAHHTIRDAPALPRSRRRGDCANPRRSARTRYPQHAPGE